MSSIQDECPVCLEPLSDSQTVTCKHGHKGHIKCLLTAHISKHYNPCDGPEKHDLQCPLCRINIKPGHNSQSENWPFDREFFFKCKEVKYKSLSSVFILKKIREDCDRKLQEYKAMMKTQSDIFSHFIKLIKQGKQDFRFTETPLCKKSDNEANYTQEEAIKRFTAMKDLTLACSQFDILKSSRLIKEIQQEFPLTPLSYINRFLSEMMYQRYMYSPRINTIKY